MHELKIQIKKILNILEKIDLNITNNNKRNVLDHNDIENANLILENAASNAIDLLNVAAVKASDIVISTASKTIISTDFDINMYLKCLIHEIKTPINNISLGINYIEKNIIENKNNNEILIIINGLNKSLEYLDDVLTKFCVIKNGEMVLNDFEPFSIKNLINDINKILQFNIEDKNKQLKWNINDNVKDNVYGDKN